MCGVCVCVFANRLCAYVCRSREKKIIHIYYIYIGFNSVRKIEVTSQVISEKSLSSEYLLTIWCNLWATASELKMSICRETYVSYDSDGDFRDETEFRIFKLKRT